MEKYEVIHPEIINCQYHKPEFMDEGGGYVEFVGYVWEDENYSGEVGTVIEVDEHGYFNEDYWRFTKDIEFYIEKGYIRKI
jgi:hypothetical protein